MVADLTHRHWENVRRLRQQTHAKHSVALNGLLLLQLDKGGANVLLSQGRLAHCLDSEWRTRVWVLQFVVVWPMRTSSPGPSSSSAASCDPWCPRWSTLRLSAPE